MKHPITAATLALAAIGFAVSLQSSAAWESPSLLRPTDAIHAGGMAITDQDLADQVVAAIAADPKLYGATVTVVANNGRISLSGSAESFEQAARAEQIARSIAGAGAVSGTLDVQGG
jgi:osmotically-inducible protein OsmY